MPGSAVPGPISDTSTVIVDWLKPASSMVNQEYLGVTISAGRYVRCSTSDRLPRIGIRRAPPPDRRTALR